MNDLFHIPAAPLILPTQAVVITDAGGNGDGVTDNAAAFDYAYELCLQTGRRTIFFPRGTYRFNRKPRDIEHGIMLLGAGITETTLVRMYTAGTASEGFLTLTGKYGTGAGCRDMSIQAGNGTSNGACLSLVATSAYAPDASNFENLWLTVQGATPGTWAFTVYIDGLARTTAPVGVRDISFTNVHVFGATNTAMTAQNVIGMRFHGGGVYSAGGSNGNVNITGGGTYGVDRSAYVMFQTNIQGQLTLQACESVNVWGMIGSFSGLASARNCMLQVVCTGAWSNLLTTSYALRQSGVS